MTEQIHSDLIGRDAEVKLWEFALAEAKADALARVRRNWNAWHDTSMHVEVAQ